MPLFAYFANFYIMFLFLLININCYFPIVVDFDAYSI